ncbi:hypothetical protein CLOM_g17473 [Closterium sp. NIES-68]|nr:hypothetical protein CLOM_g17471 [Closterium sp. NIES-68]GJP32881.1 hypothetical protein CLOM_g17473 [Closterium sp. NIES-68]GJP74863.1 hypothetical protein CLOP_g5392 [Closterium sp. NIES-67]
MAPPLASDWHKSLSGRQTALLHGCISAYFDSRDGTVFLRCQQANPDAPPVNARAIARILHGLTSPAFPTCTWSKHHFWGLYADIDFHTVRRIALEEVIASRPHKLRLRPMLK